MTIYKLDTVVNFGKKHNGETIREIIDDDPEWLAWAVDEIDWFELDDEAEAALDEATIVWEDSAWLDDDMGPAFSNLYQR